MALGGENYSSHNTEMHKALLSHVFIFSWQNRHVYKSIATLFSDLSCSKKDCVAGNFAAIALTAES